MKEYLKDLLPRIKQYSKKLDAKTILYNKNWLFLSDNNDEIVYIFRPDKELIVTVNGIGSKGKWEILFDNTICIEYKDEIRVYNAVFVDNMFLALKLDSNPKFDVLVDKSAQSIYNIKALEFSINYLEQYLPKEEIEAKPIEQKIEFFEINDDTEDNKTGTYIINFAFILLALTIIIILIWHLL